ncbi:hypothetical protein AB0J80_03470 [Actinoplanes sp. NPDC049548]|uniref:hypothetical protein n=1 Tax=Actinoplanes sp. NPDC049548 TaxID=3155152 RepID=UPI00343B4110
MKPVWISVVVALTGLSLLSACGGDSEPGAAGEDPPAAGKDLSPAEFAAKQFEVEKLIAECMKEKGFQYEAVPFAEDRPRPVEIAGTQSLFEPEDKLRPYRQKYGFGVAGQVIWPQDPVVGHPRTDTAESPNDKIRKQLDPTRLKAYEKALLGEKTIGDKGEGQPSCSDSATERVFGESLNQVTEAHSRAFEKFRTDPDVIKAAQQYGDCLRGKGYKVASVEPGSIENEVWNSFTRADGTELSMAQAKAQLPKEIQAALTDLDCRGRYAELARTKYNKAF